MRPAGKSGIALISVALLAAASGGWGPRLARAQEPAAGTARVTSTFGRTGEELDRFELGVGAMQGFFDVTGSFGYRRFLSERGPFERSIMGELTGTTKSQLTEGTLSAYFLFRPLGSYRQSWHLRPLFEFGPAGHLVVQAASIEGFHRTNYQEKVYLKTHAYAGFEALVTNRFGFLIRGRLSVPSHHPFDYAQAAVFLR